MAWNHKSAFSIKGFRSWSARNGLLAELHTCSVSLYSKVDKVNSFMKASQANQNRSTLQEANMMQYLYCNVFQK